MGTEPLIEERRVLTTINKYWAIIAGIAVIGSGAIVGYLHLQWTVADIQGDMAVYRAGADARREASRVELNELKLELKKLETDVDWLKASTRR